MFPYYKASDARRTIHARGAAAGARGEAAGEVPVGAVVVIGDEIVGRGWNAPVARHDPTAHAEIVAIREAAAAVGNYRLEGATLYCTLEPCVMCAGAMVTARIARLVFGARDLRFGGVRSKFRIADSDVLNHRVEIVEGVLAVECVELLREFFGAEEVDYAAVDSRGISVGSMITVAPGRRRLELIALMSISAACWPMVALLWSMVESGTRSRSE